MLTRQFKYKQVIAVRTDLGMTKGKLAVQVAHGAVSASERARITEQALWKSWFREGQKKVVVKVTSEEDLIQLRRDAINLGADDYIKKPFRSLELLARVKAKLRRM